MQIYALFIVWVSSIKYKHTVCICFEPLTTKNIYFQVHRKLYLETTSAVNIMIIIRPNQVREIKRGEEPT